MLEQQRWYKNTKITSFFAARCHHVLDKDSYIGQTVPLPVCGDPIPLMRAPDA